MTRARSAQRCKGFTLVELLTVIGIISLLISILLPSLARARDQAKKLAVQAQISALEKGLEMFQNDFKNYPDSGYGQDPIDWSSAPAPKPANGEYLTGAHWLARALAGHDSQGVDTKGVMLQRGFTANNIKLNMFKDPDPDNAPKPGVLSDRKGTYIDAPVFAKDNDTVKFPTQGANAPNTGRAVIFEKYNFPVIYYRANSRARYPFCITGSGTQAPGNGNDDALGVYNQSDNAAITGGHAVENNSIVAKVGWDFAGASLRHGIGDFGDPNNNDAVAATGYKGKTFINFLHDENTHTTTGNVIKALNPEGFMLISAGKDGIYGTDDDVTNVKGGGL